MVEKVSLSPAKFGSLYREKELDSYCVRCIRMVAEWY
jgi:hypothetical protein